MAQGLKQVVTFVTQRTWIKGIFFLSGSTI